MTIPVRTAIALKPFDLDNIARQINTEGIRGIKLNVTNRNSPSVTIEAEDQEMLFKASMMVRALIARFSLDESRSLLGSENYLVTVPLKADLPPRDRTKNNRLPISRLESFESLNLRVIRNFTGVASRFYDGSVWLLGPAESVQEASREVRQILMGRTRGTVQQFHRGKNRILVKRCRKREARNHNSS